MTKNLQASSGIDGAHRSSNPSANEGELGKDPLGDLQGTLEESSGSETPALGG